ncbi:23S rRNA (uracil(1939)-C(5))-methyltransferase RlmD [Bombilactobacillus folatiphilus]|uniref:23S rRNA (Uracil(1939)-C(5))-methyltransferase RlmD n=1 Tax=Bombilactobacillus folatiphilus TaxID=2923362 RepID=A0ABY4P8B0_9LACO|nr:23S rRNA (uracil(1939)-C(5))-methyltransferase RlmD [Bombilactobacillus folatiphilus]UQS81751.1 23S rRNA (uracil(1939)-C(5))-methyltransferase RlmD [Bombilactobacillus folatiphilus]
MSKDTLPIKIGQKLQLEIKKMGINGEGIGYYHQKLVFVPQVLPGEQVQCEITAIQPHFLRGKCLTRTHDSSLRNHQVPTLYGKVGGLELAHLKYPAQLNFKRLMVKQALQHFQPQGFRHYQVLPTIGMDEPWHYRNKAQFQLQEQAGQVVCGLYQNHSHQVVDSLTMPTQSCLTLSILQRLVPIIQQLQLPIFDEEHNSGIFKTLVVRESTFTKTSQLTVITNSRKFPKLRQFLALLNAQIPEVDALFQNYNPAPSHDVWGAETKLLWGKEYLVEQINNQQFALSPRAFLQLNPIQTQKLYQLVQKTIDPQPDDILVDAYAGVGTIGISLAPKVAQVLGSETIPEAVHDANLNAQQNHLANAHYTVGATEELYPKWLAQGLRPTSLVVDPPRVGLANSLVELLVKSGPAKVVYVSCNPSTLARDLRQLAPVYQVQSIQPIDMFPQTPHVESMTVLERKKERS